MNASRQKRPYALRIFKLEKSLHFRGGGRIF
jgi:hypothetical protein